MSSRAGLPGRARPGDGVRRGDPLPERGRGQGGQVGAEQHHARRFARRPARRRRIRWNVRSPASRCARRGACASAAPRPSGRGAARLTRTSAPVSNAAWSSWDCRQLWCWASTSVPVATASTTSRTAATLPHGAPAHLPAGQGRGEPPAAGAQPVQQPGRGGQGAQREQRDPGQGQRRGHREHRVDAEPVARTAGEPPSTCAAPRAPARPGRSARRRGRPAPRWPARPACRAGAGRRRA